MVKITRVYTRQGDDGRTSLGDGSRTSKCDPRVEAYGEVDAANAAIGLAAAACDPRDRREQAIRQALLRVQQDLFDVGADLCAPKGSDEAEGARLRVTPQQSAALEQLIDRFNERLAPLTSFVLPGGSELAARLHLARAMVRTAERRVAVLLEEQPDTTHPEPLVYLNRLSDLLFVLARAANDDGAGDTLWKPGANQSQA